MKADSHSILIKNKQFKIYKPSHSWGMKLSQYHRTNSPVHIITYSLPNLEYSKHILSKRPEWIYIICHDKFYDKAFKLKKMFPNIEIRTSDRVHTKLLLVGKDSVYLGSPNFGDSHNWHEMTFGTNSKEAYVWCRDKIFIPFWNNLEPLCFQQGLF